MKYYLTINNYYSCSFDGYVSIWAIIKHKNYLDSMAKGKFNTYWLSGYDFMYKYRDFKSQPNHFIFCLKQIELTRNFLLRYFSYKIIINPIEYKNF